MKYYTIPAFVIWAFFSINIANAQSAPVMQRAPLSVNIDGIVAEWKDSSPQFDVTNKLGYTIANDDANLYISAFTKDLKTKRKISLAGITISVNTEGKKRKTYKLTYPAPGTFSQHKTDTITSTNIKTSGFKDGDIEVDALSNPFGFKAAFKYDDYFNLGYEMAIPLKSLALNSDKSNLLYINICVNGIELPAGGSNQPVAVVTTIVAVPSSGMGSNGGTNISTQKPIIPYANKNQPVNDITESHDFWLKFVLASH